MRETGTIIAAEAVILAVEQNPLQVSHTVVWAEEDIDGIARLPDKYLKLEEVLDIPPDRIGQIRSIAGIVAVGVDLP